MKLPLKAVYTLEALQEIMNERDPLKKRLTYKELKAGGIDVGKITIGSVGQENRMFVKYLKSRGFDAFLDEKTEDSSGGGKSPAYENYIIMSLNAEFMEDVLLRQDWYLLPCMRIVPGVDERDVAK